MAANGSMSQIFTYDYYFYRARYYEPATGRFTQMDPIFSGTGSSMLSSQFSGSNLYFADEAVFTPEIIGTPEMYIYASNNPILGIDPFGLFTYTDCSYYDKIAGACRKLKTPEQKIIYYTFFAPTACRKAFGASPWESCTRACLIVYDAQHNCAGMGNCGCDPKFGCHQKAHFYCYYKCFRNPNQLPIAGPSGPSTGQ